MPLQLVVIDPHVANHQLLIDQLGSTYSFLLLSADLDGVTQIADYVAANPGFDAVHLISHGSPGQVAVGTSTLFKATIGGYTAQLNQIGASLNAGGDLLIYGCDVARGVGGQQLITDLSRLTQLDVAASTNRTGSSGDWVLEAATGSIENTLPQLQYLMALTDTPAISSGMENAFSVAISGDRLSLIVTKLKPSGSVDTTWWTNGSSTIPSSTLGSEYTWTTGENITGSPGLSSTTVTQANDGSAILALTAWSKTNFTSGLFLLKLNQAGTSTTLYSNTSNTTTGNPYYEVRKIFADNSGGYILLGQGSGFHGSSLGSWDVIATKFSPSGQPLSGWGTGGDTFFTLPGTSWFNHLPSNYYENLLDAIQLADGRFLVLEHYTGNANKLSLFRFNTNGQIDTSFGADGYVDFYSYTGETYRTGSLSLAESQAVVTSQNDLFFFDVTSGTLQSRSFVNEGENADFNFSLPGASTGTSVSYSVAGLSSADIVGGSLSGSTTVGANGFAYVSIPIKTDLLTEGNENLSVTLQGKTITTTVRDTSVIPISNQTVSPSGGFCTEILAPRAMLAGDIKPYEGFVLPNGKSVIAYLNAQSLSTIVARLNSDGTIDTSFGTSGFVDVPVYATGGLAIAPRGNGDVWIASNTGDNSNPSSMQIHQISANGSSVTHILTSPTITTVSAISEVAGTGIVYLGLGPNAAVSSGMGLRFIREGGQGAGNSWFDLQDGTVESAAINADGSAVVLVKTGWAGTIGPEALRLVKFSTAGTVDNSFGINGQVQLKSYLDSTGIRLQAFGGAPPPQAIGVWIPDPLGVEVDQLGRILVAFDNSSITGDPRQASLGGSGVPYQVTNSSIAVARYLSNGVLDTSFGSAGIATYSLSGDAGFYSSSEVSSAGTSLADGLLSVDSQGRAIVTFSISGSFRVVRFTNLGTLDTVYQTSSGSQSFSATGSTGDRPMWTAFSADQGLLVGVVDTSTSTNVFSIFKLADPGSTIAPPVDTIAPTVAISSSRTSLADAHTASLVFTLSEPSTNFGVGDIEVSGGTLGNFAGSGAAYTATFTPAANKRETAKVSVGSGTFSDAAGNANVDGNDADNTVLLTIDTMVNRAPTASGAKVSGLQDAMVAINAAAIGFRDPDKGDVLQSITITSLPGKGSLLLGGSAVSLGQVISADEINGGSLAFKGAAMQSGTGYASFGFKVSDGRTLSAAEAKITFNLKAVNYPPVVANPIADQQVSEGQAFTLKLASNTFTDLESPVLSYSAALSSGKPLPKWLKFDAKTGTFSGTPSELDAGVASISVKATDAGKASVADTFDLTVLDINRAPVAKALTTTPSATEGKAFTFAFPKTTFVDPDRGDVLTYSVSGAPAWLAIDPLTGKLSGTPNYAAADTATITVTLQATDKQSLSASTPLTIKLVNVAKIVGTADSNTLIAGAGGDSISGLAGNDALNGGAGNDIVVGGLGDDQLTGGDGQDRFVFESAIKNGGNVDTVTDFVSGSDTIALAGSIFTALRGDTDLSDNLWLTTSTSHATVRSSLVFDPQSGALSYDPDGSGPATSIEICTLVGVTKLGPGDLLMV